MLLTHFQMNVPLNYIKTVTSVGQFLATFMFLLSLFKSNFSIIIIACNIYFDFE